MIEVTGTRLSYRSSGVVSPPAGLPLAQRLAALHDGLHAALRAETPDEVAVEETFVNRDPVATLKLGQARGVALLVPALMHLPVSEYAANQVKKTVVGVGHADKRQVQAMVKVLLPRAKFGSTDAADALAIAICHAHQRPAAALRAVGS